MLASDLIGLGLSSHLARRLANGGAGSSTSLQIAAAGSTAANATQIGGQQFFVSVNSGTGGVTLPAIGGDNGALLADDFIINNATGSTITCFMPTTGGNISAAGSNIAGSTGVSILSHTTWTLYPVSSTQWVGVKGA